MEVDGELSEQGCSSLLETVEIIPPAVTGSRHARSSHFASCVSWPLPFIRLVHNICQLAYCSETVSTSQLIGR